ncbi:MAG: hypothetical protein CBD39_01980 [Flavobacteriaceae bacterium TMED179]|nr:MAG: hypothetical protein CBD39_01980 [Flavobacteriaceae bacterium TMED179]|tara:strand:+ start:18546 stop:19598 length:1053 start_codon:yes stop_codon:yes gene_type:complete
MKKTHIILIGLLPVQLIGLLFIKNHNSWIDVYYSQKFYPLLFNIYRFFFEKIPFSIGDLFYAIIILYILKNIIMIFKRKKIVWLTIIRNGLSFLSLILFIFNFNWGLNYYQTPLHKKLYYNINYKKIQIEKTFKILIKASNNLHKKLVKTDSLSVEISYSKDFIAQKIEDEFNFDLYKFKPKPYLKNSLWGTLLSYMGYSGYLNPFTLESQVNNKIPKLSYIITSAHEMSHQLGIASEREANFVAFYSCIKHSDPFIQYSGYTFAISYFYSELFNIDPQKAKKIMKKLNPGILKNLLEISQFWIHYQNSFEPILKKGYNSYLIANGQKRGIKSYNDMVGLVIAYLEKESL